MLCLLLSTAGLGQKLSVLDQRGAIVETQRAPWPRVALDISILDRNDGPAKGITAAQFGLEEDGQSVTDVSLVPDTGPESVCLLVDSSGSTYYERDAVLAEVKQLIASLPPEDELCGVDFSSEAFMGAPLGSDRKEMFAWLDTVRAHGATALLDAVTSVSLLMMQRSKYPRRSIILISDGEENNSATPEREVLRMLHTLGAPTILVLENQDYTGEKPDRRLLQLLTGAGGGLEFPIRRKDDPKSAVDHLLAVMAGRYRMEFTSPDPVENATERKLSVQLNKDLRKQRMNIAVPDGYLAAGRH
jgi:hypothetical protein